MSHLAVMAVGRDRPGIVQAVSEVLLDHGLNIEDSRMTLLGGHFATMLIVAGPDGRPDEQALSSALLRAGERVGLEQVSVRALTQTDGDGRAEPSHVVTVYGSDHPGIVHGVASALGDREVNITDLHTLLIPGDDAEPAYVMRIEVQLPERMRVDALEQALTVVAAAQGVDVTIEPLEPGERHGRPAAP